MSEVVYREQLPIYEVHLDDGGFGIQIARTAPYTADTTERT